MSKTQNDIAELFDLIASSFEYEKQSFRVFIEACFKNGELDDEIVLDAGCGTGITSAFFAQKRTKQVVGIDLSSQSLATANKLAEKLKLKNLSYQQGALQKLPFRDNTIDVIFTIGVLPYVSDLHVVLDEFKRVLKKNGTMLIMSLRKRKIDSVYEAARLVFSKMPAKLFAPLSNAIAKLAKPFAGFFLGRNRNEAATGEEKSLQQTILETLFSPTRLLGLDAKEITSYLSKKGVHAAEIFPPVTPFYSPVTNFVLKGKKV